MKGEAANDTHAIVNRYTGTQANIVTLLNGIQNRAAVDGVEVRYSENDVSIASGASVVVVVVRSEVEGESHDRAKLTMRAEDAQTLVSLQQQHQQHQQHHQVQHQQAKVKVVVVVISGGPVDTSQPASVMGSGFVTSVLAAWIPGEEGGNAIAALLWGDADFSAALAVTAYVAIPPVLFVCKIKAPDGVPRPPSCAAWSSTALP